MLIEKADQLYMEDIRDFIKEKATKIKRNEDQQIKDQSNILKKIPSW